VERNLALLKDHDRVAAFVAQNQPRFEHNLALLKTNPFLQICMDRLQYYSKSEQDELRTIIHTYRDGVLTEPLQQITPPEQKGQ
jgi:hypothetical protein